LIPNVLDIEFNNALYLPNRTEKIIRGKKRKRTEEKIIGPVLTEKKFIPKDLGVNYDSEFHSPTPSKVKLGLQGIILGPVVVPFKISGLPNNDGETCWLNASVQFCIHPHWIEARSHDNVINDPKDIRDLFQIVVSQYQYVGKVDWINILNLKHLILKQFKGSVDLKFESVKQHDALKAVITIMEALRYIVDVQVWEQKKCIRGITNGCGKIQPESVLKGMLNSSLFVRLSEWQNSADSKSHFTLQELISEYPATHFFSSSCYDKCGAELSLSDTLNGLIPQTPHSFTHYLKGCNTLITFIDRSTSDGKLNHPVSQKTALTFLSENKLIQMEPFAALFHIGNLIVGGHYVTRRMINGTCYEFNDDADPKIVPCIFDQPDTYSVVLVALKRIDDSTYSKNISVTAHRDISNSKDSHENNTQYRSSESQKLAELNEHLVSSSQDTGNEIEICLTDAETEEELLSQYSESEDETSTDFAESEDETLTEYAKSESELSTNRDNDESSPANDRLEFIDISLENFLTLTKDFQVNQNALDVLGRLASGNLKYNLDFSRYLLPAEKKIRKRVDIDSFLYLEKFGEFSRSVTDDIFVKTYFECPPNSSNIRVSNHLTVLTTKGIEMNISQCPNILIGRTEKLNLAIRLIFPDMCHKYVDNKKIFLDKVGSIQAMPKGRWVNLLTNELCRILYDTWIYPCLVQIGRSRDFKPSYKSAKFYRNGDYEHNYIGTRHSGNLIRHLFHTMESFAVKHKSIKDIFGQTYVLLEGRGELYLFILKA
jgi:hypothetical protein